MEPFKNVFTGHDSKLQHFEGPAAKKLGGGKQEHKWDQGNEPSVP